MIQASFTDIERLAISKNIKMISLKDATEDFNKLKLIGNNLVKNDCNISSRL